MQHCMPGVSVVEVHPAGGGGMEVHDSTKHVCKKHMALAMYRMTGVVQVHPAGGSDMKSTYFIDHIYNNHIAFTTLHGWCGRCPSCH